MPMMSKIIYTDIDGVCLDWEPGFHDYMQHYGHRQTGNGTDYWMESRYPQLSFEEAQRMVEAFNSSVWMMDLKPFRDARTGIARLLDNGYKFVGITAFGTHRYQEAARKLNLASLFGEGAFLDVIGTDMHDVDSKKKHLEKCVNPEAHYWIEDNTHNAELGAQLGYSTILMDHPHNAEYEPKNTMTRVSDWNGICDVILGSD